MKSKNPFFPPSFHQVAKMFGRKGRRQYAHILLAGLGGSVALVLLTVEDINSLEERDLAVPPNLQKIFPVKTCANVRISL